MNALAVKGLCKRYPAFSLENVSFSVPEGAVMGFIGRNGAGKSTTLKSILGWCWAALISIPRKRYGSSAT